MSIVAPGALGKAMLHLHGGAAPDMRSPMVLALIVRRTASAFVPLRVAAPPTELYPLGRHLCRVAPPVLGLANLIGWASLSSLACVAWDDDFYTMSSKPALGAAGLALVRASVFAPGGFPVFAAGIAAGCMVAALIGLTCRRYGDLHQ